MKYLSKAKSRRAVLRLIVGLTTSLFVLSLSSVLDAGGFNSQKGWFGYSKPVNCGAELKYGLYKLTGDLNCAENPAIKITGSAKLNLKGYTLSGNGDNNCILINGYGAEVLNGTVKNCRDGILIDKSDRNKIINVEASNNDKRGFHIIESDQNMLYKCLAEENDKEGFLIEKGDGNIMVHCKSKDNYKKGFTIDEGDDNLVIRCLATKNGHQGFNIEKGAGNKIYNSQARANCRDGIELAKTSTGNWISYNLVENNGNEESCRAKKEDYKPHAYGGIDIEDGCEYNEIKHNHACGNQGCNGEECLPRERNFWDENLDNGDCVSVNEWENNTVCPECSPKPDN